MRIGFFGDGRWGCEALDLIADASEFEVAYIVVRHRSPDVRLKERARNLDVPLFSPEDVNRQSFLDELSDYDPDLNVSMSYDQILRPPAIDMAPKGFVNCHAGALPFYRGRNVLNWALINGEDRFGVTVHYIDEHIDKGDIIAQQFGPITPDDTYRSLLRRAVGLCADTLLTALRQIHEGTATRKAQDTIHPVGFYSSRRREGDEWIDWSWPTERVHNLVRAISPPGPGARTLLDGTPIVILESEVIPQAPEYIDRPGTVVGRDENGIEVKTGDTTLKVTKVADWTGEVSNSRVPAYRIGTSFGQNLHQEVVRLRDKISRLEARLEALNND
jgi:methionyl-tRNA formyltransferase